MKWISIIFFLFVWSTTPAQENSDAFTVNIRDYSVRVVSPKEKRPKAFVIINNETLTNIYIQIMGDGEDIVHANLLSQKTFSHEIDFAHYKQITIVPLSPPNMSVDLKFSDKVYEIPTRNE